MSYAIATVEARDTAAHLWNHKFLHFLKHSQNHCVGIVDIMNSTKGYIKTVRGSDRRISRHISERHGWYVRSFGGTSIKNMGNALLFSFPDIPGTCASRATFEMAIECCMAMIRRPVRIAKPFAGTTNDIFGHTVNLCAKMNCMAPANGVNIDESHAKRQDCLRVRVQ